MRPVMKILYGPPGTGKTWQAAREAVKAAEPKAYSDALQARDPDQAIRQLHQNLINDQRVVWVSFHPSYSYEDFFEGYRPIVDQNGQLSYKVVDGPFKTLCMRARNESDLQIGEQLTDAGGRPAGIVVDKDPGGWIIRVTPGRADEIAPSIDKYVARYVIERIMEKGFPPSIFSIPGAGLHPLDEYGINPADQDVPEPDLAHTETQTDRNGSTIRRIVAARTGMFSSSDISNSSHIGSVYRRLLELRARGGRPSHVVMVIDEINRADLSRVFGGFLTLMEPDKRGGMPEERQVWLPYSKTQFSVPPNLSIIGTMNTVDRSLSAMDFAMRRRFDFELVDADPSLCPNDYGGVNLRDVLNTINRRLDVILGKEHRLGHALFMPHTLEAILDIQGWTGRPDKELRTIAHVMRTRVVPTLIEYFHDDWRKAQAVAGTAVIGEVSTSLFDQTPLDATLAQRLPEDYEVDDSRSLGFAPWWNPEVAVWDANRFRAFMGALASGK